MGFKNYIEPPCWGLYINWEFGKICLSAYGGTIETGVRRQALYKFSSVAKRYTNVFNMTPQRRQVLYECILEDHHVGVMQCARAQEPFQHSSQEQLTVDFKPLGLIKGLYGIWRDTRIPKV